jgi:hypothetical protein
MKLRQLTGVYQHFHLVVRFLPGATIEGMEAVHFARLSRQQPE